MNNPIEISTEVFVPVSTAWEFWCNPKHVMGWNFAADTWHCPRAENELEEGKQFNDELAARDGSITFDFIGTFDRIIPEELLQITLGDGRKMEVHFEATEQGCKVLERFEPESENSREMQEMGWQAILNNFKSYTERSI
jgi:uncharacterized protein YndB with AHSA1/START domain